MSKKLIIVRHAKSSWDYEGIADYDRPLRMLGINNAQVISGKIKNAGIMPDAIVSSFANRALHTAIIFASRLGFPLEKIKITEKLYEVSLEQVLDLIQKTDDSISSLMIFGHNPVSTGLSNYFLATPIDNLPTSGAAFVELDIKKWSEIKKGKVLKTQLFVDKNGNNKVSNT
jgi:phosphohistidine phosphatase